MSSSTIRRTLRYPQLAKEPLLTSSLKGNPINRVWAKVLDVSFVAFWALFLGWFWAPLAWIAPIILFCVMDRWGKWQSPGKWMMGLHTVRVERGARPTLYNCLIRNLPFIQVFASLHMSHFWQWFLLPTGLLWLVLELYFVMVLRSGVRVGDILGHTRVFDYKDEHTKFIEEFLKDENAV